MFMTILKYLWVMPATLVGLVIASIAVLTGGSVQVYSGAIEAWGGFATWVFKSLLGRGCAMTIGHVIIAQDERSVSRYRLHEHVHIEQYEKWGPLFIPLYLASSVMAWLEGKHFYRDNVFEREAYWRYE